MSADGPVDLSQEHPAVAGADSYNQLFSGTSSYQLPEDGLGLFNSPGKLLGTASISALYGALNSGVAIMNLLPGADIKEFSVADTLRNIDKEWLNYYEGNQSTIDTLGFIGGSFAPGMLGIKAIKMMQAGSGLGFAGKAMRFVSADQRATWMREADAAFRASGGTAFEIINRAKYKSMATAFAEQALYGAAFETAVSATMFKSPVLEHEGFTDIAKNIAFGAVLNGALGGGIEALLTKGKYRKLVLGVEQDKRVYEDLYQPVLGALRADGGKVELAPVGDQVFKMLDSIMDLPQATGDAASFAGVRARNVSAEETAARGLVSKLLANNDAVLGNAFFDTLLAARDDALRISAGDKTAARSMLDDMLVGAKSIRRMEMDEVDLLHRIQTDSFYLPKTITPEAMTDAITNARSNKDFIERLGGLARAPQNAGDGRFMFIGDGHKVRVAFQGLDDGQYLTHREAFADGVDVFIAGNRLEINKKSAIIRELRTPATTGEFVLHLPTGRIMQDAYLTVGDMMRNSSDIKAHYQLLSIPSRNMDFLQPAPGSSINWNQLTALEANARYVWAHTYDFSEKALQIIHETDLPMLERVWADPEVRAFKLVTRDGTHVDITDKATLFDRMVEAKAAVQRDLEAGAKEDIKRGFRKTDLDERELLLKLNAKQTWLESPEHPMNLFEETSKYLQPNNAIIKFTNNNSLLTPDGHVARGTVALEQRIKLMTDIRQTAVASVLGDEVFSALPEFAAKDVMEYASSQRQGGTAFAALNADYGDWLRAAVTLIGNKTHQLIETALAEVGSHFGTVAEAIKSNEKAAAELGVLTTFIRGSKEKYVLRRDSVLGGENYLLHRDLAKMLDKGEDLDLVHERILEMEALGGRPVQPIEHAEVADFLEAHQAKNRTRIESNKKLATAVGRVNNFDPDVVYVPPVDTRKYQFVAFVRDPNQEIFGSTQVAALIAKDQEQLSAMIAAVERDGKMQVITKRGSKEWHEALGDYDYDLALNENSVNPYLQGLGKLRDFFPEVRAQNVLEDYIGWNARQATRTVRNAIEVQYAQQFAELRFLGKRFTEVATSRAAGTPALLRQRVDNPFEDYIKVALDVSRRSEYTLWQDANDFVDNLGRKFYGVVKNKLQDASKGLITWQEADEQAFKYGLGRPYANGATASFMAENNVFNAANEFYERPIFSDFIHNANMVLANTFLRFDFFQAINNLISTPILLGTELSSIRRMVAGDDALAGKLLELRNIAVPGREGQAVPSSARLIADAIRNYFGADKEALIARYRSTGAIRDILAQYHDVVDTLTITGRETPSELRAAMAKAADFAGKWTGNQHAEEMTRFIAADVMRQLTDPIVAAGKMTAREQDAYMLLFTNRVQGNYLASQRPIAFQGVIGQAIGLFQTYQFNLMQQLFRHVENGDKKTALLMMGLQGSIYGLQGVPFFNAVNTHLVGNNPLNPGHKDFFSVTPQVLGKELGDWLMYGTASAFPLMPESMPSIYTRGDINPRHFTILPTTIADLMPVKVSVQVIDNLVDMGRKAADGGKLSAVLMEGLEHNGLNRPLAGLAQFANGYTTTGKGSLISAAQDFDAIAQFGRLLGAKPFTEAMALDALYRSNAYKSKDAERREQLGAAVKTRLRNNQVPTPEETYDFMVRYAASGGTADGFQRSMAGWMKGANVSVVNAATQQLKRPAHQRILEMMGGQGLDDFWTQPPEASPPK